MARTTLVGCVALLLASFGCGDDVAPATSDSESATDGSTGPSTPIDPTSSGPTSVGPTSDGTTSADTDDDDTGTTMVEDSTSTGETSETATDTGEPEQPGHPASGFVNAGTVSVSPSYRLVWTFGQETQNQNTMDSPSFTLHGGLVGAVE